MALARAKAFQEAKAKEEQQRNIEKIFKVTIVKPGDAGGLIGPTCQPFLNFVL
jgi:hypothetical protein